MWIQNESIIWDLKIFYLVVLLGIQNMVLVCSKTFAEMYIIRIAAKAGGIKWTDFDTAFFHFLHYTFV